MWKPLVKSGIVGGVIVYIWIMISWIVLPWHITTINRFANPESVSQVILNNAPKDGIYVLVSVPETAAEGQGTMTAGPFMFASIKRNGIDMMDGKPYIISFITQLVAAFLISWLYLHTKTNHYWRGVLFVTVAGFIAAILNYIPGATWWGYPCAYVSVGILDMIISWFLAGLAIAKLAMKK